MKLKSFVLIVIIVTVSGCHLIPNQSDLVPTIADETIGNIETNQPEIISTLQTTEEITITAPTEVTAIKPTDTLLPISTPSPYRLQANSPVYIQNFAHPENGCNWLGVAGQVLDKTGQPVINQVVVVKGQLADGFINSVTLTGLNSASEYGPGGYEVVLGNKPIASKKLISIQLFDENGIPQSDPIFIETFLDCQQNLIIVNFEAIDS